MPRYIDADALELKQKTIYMEFENVAVPTRVISIADLHLAPTIDAVEVVRCKDCKHRGIVSECPMCYTEDSYDDDYGYEYWDVDKTVDEGFCHCGEKAAAEVEG